jgi:endonuclease/exonuclease/phosphatase family metal-dependent hydrolase
MAIWYGQSRVFKGFRSVTSLDLGYQGTDSPDSEFVTVGTFNIAHGRGGVFGASNWTGRPRRVIEKHLGRIGAQIRDASADLMVLNETDFSSAWSHNLDQAQAIAEAAGFHYVLEQRNMDISLPFLTFRFGNAVISRYPLAPIRFVDFPPFSRKEDLFAGNHDGLLCRAKTPIGEIRVLAIHLEYRSEETRVECARMIAKIEAEEDTPLVVLGDFNSSPSGYPGQRTTVTGKNAMNVLLNSGRFHTIYSPDGVRSDLTFPSSSPRSAIDWIVTTTNAHQSDKKIYQSNLSDHHMVTTRLSLRNDQSE